MVKKLENHQYSEGAEGQSLVSWITHAAVYTQRWEEGTVWENIWLQASNPLFSLRFSRAISLALSDFCKIKLFKEINDWKHNAYPRSFSSSLPSLIFKSLFLSEFPFFSLFSTLVSLFSHISVVVYCSCFICYDAWCHRAHGFDECYIKT